MEEKLKQLVQDIQDGYGWVGSSMLEIYADELELDAKEVVDWFKERYIHAEVNGEECFCLAGWVSLESFLREIQ